MTSYGETALVRGLSFLAEKQASIANNIANVDTTSFKRRSALAVPAGTFHSLLDRQLSAVSYVERADMQRGILRETGNRFDVAVDGPYWMRVQNDKGERFYTRNGQLQLAGDGRLWVVDTWFFDNGGPTFVVDRDEWRGGWHPEGGAGI